MLLIYLYVKIFIFDEYERKFDQWSNLQINFFVSFIYSGLTFLVLSFVTEKSWRTLKRSVFLSISSLIVLIFYERLAVYAVSSSANFFIYWASMLASLIIFIGSSYVLASFFDYFKFILDKFSKKM